MSSIEPQEHSNDRRFYKMSQVVSAKLVDEVGEKEARALIIKVLDVPSKHYFHSEPQRWVTPDSGSLVPCSYEQATHFEWSFTWPADGEGVADREGERIEADGGPVARPKLLGFESAIYRIRELHQPNGTRMYGKESATGLYCGACGDLTDEYGIPWPCPTIQALDGEQA